MASRRGYVVNYELAALPGLPEVRTVDYPDDNRAYFKKGDAVLLLTYTNAPYRMVYDTIKVIDEQNAIGVMHLGTFPNGIEFSTFVMARHNYPFEYMSAPDAEALSPMRGRRRRMRRRSKASGTGVLILLKTPHTSLLNQVSPVLFHASFHAGSASCSAAGVQFGRGPNLSELRLLGPKTLLGKWTGLDPAVAKALGETIYFVLKRA